MTWKLEGLNQLTADINNWAVGKGFWDTPNVGEKIALMHSELSEALEGHRHGDPNDEHCPKFTSLEIEMADCIIRILDFSGFYGLDIEGAIAAKMEFNSGRPYRHGKKF